MPSGGQISAGSGLRLQSTTPGVTDVGNAHISGTFIANTEIYSNNNNERLLKYGNNPLTNYNSAFSGSPLAINLLMGSANAISDGNVIQNCAFVGNANLIGNATHVGLTACLVLGSNNTLLEGGHLTSTQGTVIVGNSNHSNWSLGHDQQNNFLPIIIGINNAWASVKGVSAGAHGVIIDYGLTVQNDLDNIVAIHAARDGQIIASNTVKIGNNLQSHVKIGAYDIEALNASMVKTKFRQTSNVVVVNTISESTIVGSGVGSKTIAANTLIAGSQIRIIARGYIRSLTAPSLQMRIYLDAVNFIDFGSMALAAIAGDVAWELSADLTVRTDGAGGTALGNGLMSIGASTAKIFGSINSATTALDTTVAHTVDVTATWSAASAQNYIGCTNLEIEVLG